MENKKGMQVTLTAQQGPFLGRTGVLEGTLRNYSGQAYHCRSISIHVPVGNEEESLYFNDDKTVITSKTPAWNRLPCILEEMQEEEAVLRIEMQDGGMRPLKDTVNFTVSGNVNLAEGSSVVTYAYEYSTDGGKNFRVGEEKFVFEKRTSSFYLKNLLTAKPDSPANYCTQFEPGKKILFSWESNGTQFEIYKKDETSPIYTGTNTSFTYTDGIDSDTTFLLRAVQSQNALKAPDADEKETLKLGTKALFETITLTTVKPTFQTVHVLERLSGNEAEVSLLSVGIPLTFQDGGDNRKFRVTSDGIITGNLLCSGEKGPSSAFLRISVYRDSKEQYTARECAFCAQMLCEGNKSLKVCRPANAAVPVSPQDVVIIQSGMESPSGSLREHGYDAQLFYHPFGKGKVEYL